VTRLSLAVIAALAAATAGCGNGSMSTPTVMPASPVASMPAPKPPPVGAVPVRATTTPAALLPSAPAVPASAAPDYDAKGRRDPFEEVATISGGSGLLVSTTKLTGIIHSGRSTLALVETPEGIGYIVKPGDTLGDGRLLEIGVDNVVFAVTPRAGSSSNRVVLRLAAN